MGKIIFLAGIFLIAVSLLLAGAGDTTFYTLFSKQGTINPNSLTGEYDPANPVAIFDSHVLSPPALVRNEQEPSVLGQTNVAKRIEVDLTNQKLYAYEGQNRIYEFTISSGKWNRTPKGVFKIWIKLRHTLMKGGSEALGTYYYLPNVPYVMFFHNEATPKEKGYGIHAAYWHNNFGQPMSHGCINMKEEDAKMLYYWAEPVLKGNPSVNASANNPGTELIIYGDYESKSIESKGKPTKNGRT